MLHDSKLPRPRRGGNRITQNAMPTLSNSISSFLILVRDVWREADNQRANRAAKDCPVSQIHSVHQRTRRSMLLAIAQSSATKLGRDWACCRDAELQRQTLMLAQ